MANWTAAVITDLTAYNSPSATIAAAAAFATDGTSVGATVTPTKADEKLIIELSNANSGASKDVTITKGNGSYAADSDLVVALAASEVKIIQLETALYKQMSGTHKGKILFSGTTENKIRAFQCV